MISPLVDHYYLSAWVIATRAPDTHPFIVALEVAGLTSDTDAFLLALLHDSVEDGYASLEEIERVFSEQIVKGVKSLTRRKGEVYRAYIMRLREEGPEIARIVKIADASVNLRRSVRDHKWSLARRYELALKELGVEPEIYI